jgi:hypothetical protein
MSDLPEFHIVLDINALFTPAEDKILNPAEVCERI